jgi:hypothetical protein
MTKKLLREIQNFRNAMRAKDYKLAQSIIDLAKHRSASGKIAWQWELDWEIARSPEKLDDLHLLLTESDFNLNLLDLYFLKCLFYKDKTRFNKVYSKENLKNCDDSLPVYYSAIRNFLNDLPSSDAEKKMAKFFYTDRDAEFLRYLNS